jgi:hypothetical protein
LGSAQSLALSYVGASNKRLLSTEFITNPNPNFASANLVGNAGTSNYQALQARFQRRLTNGLQALVSYTWSHSIDTGSYGAYQNGSFANINANRGDSDYDVRNAFSGSVTYEIPPVKTNVFTRALTSGWSTDNIVQIHSGPPDDIFDFIGGNYTAVSSTNAAVFIRPDVIPGQPLYLHGSQYPGKKALNPAAFTNPPLNPSSGLPVRQGDLGRNVLRSLGLTEWDFAAHREFNFSERIKLQFRAELFNVLNHPNFGPFNNSFENNNGNMFFGQATEMLNQYLGTNPVVGGQNALYTLGGPRSGQLALKLTF